MKLKFFPLWNLDKKKFIEINLNFKAPAQKKMLHTEFSHSLKVIKCIAYLMIIITSFLILWMYLVGNNNRITKFSLRVN